MTYEFLQHYWCFIVSLLGALLVFLLFVQGANSVASSLGQTEEGRRLVYNSTGRKWEFTFTTLVTFGGAFFASFPLFYSTSFGGAYWLWMIILFTFVLQAVSYEFQNKIGNILGPRTFQFFLTLNGILGPLDEGIRLRGRGHLIAATVPFLVLFVAYLVHLLLKEGFAYNPASEIIYMEPYKYFNNFIEMWYLLVVLLIGVVLVLFGIGKTIFAKGYVGGIWPAGIGTVLTVLALLLCSAWNNTAYYPSTADLQSSLTIQNSCSSEFTLTTMFYVSLLVPFVLAYIIYAWYAIDKKKLTKEDLTSDHAY